VQTSADSSFGYALITLEEKVYRYLVAYMPIVCWHQVCLCPASIQPLYSHIASLP
jgi:hypothetical protein